MKLHLIHNLYHHLYFCQCGLCLYQRKNSNLIYNILSWKQFCSLLSLFILPLRSGSDQALNFVLLALVLSCHRQKSSICKELLIVSFLYLQKWLGSRSVMLKIVD